MATKRRIEVKFPRAQSVPTLDSLKRHYPRCHVAECRRCALHGILTAHDTMKRAVRRAQDAGATQRDVALVFTELLLITP